MLVLAYHIEFDVLYMMRTLYRINTNMNRYGPCLCLHRALSCPIPGHPMGPAFLDVTSWPEQ
jgi:hypothetical protein